jgi:hypothetical protein
LEGDGLLQVSNKNMNKFLPLLIFAGIIFLSSCKKDKEIYDPGYSFYPLEVGNWKIYQVKKISYQPYDTTFEDFEIKEIITEEFTINNEARFRVERFKRADSTLAWPATPDSIWSIANSKSKIVQVENNTRFVKITFPVEDNKSWNGNIENDLGADDYMYINVSKPYTVLSSTFPKTATVLQSNDSSLVDKDYRWEVYADEVGMIFKLKEMYEYKQSCWKCGQIDEGIKYYERLISYGKQ